MKEDEKIDLDAFADFDDEVTAHLDKASASSVPEETPAETPAVPETPAREENYDPFEAARSASTEEPAPRPQYGAPQSLFEDIIPADFFKDDLKAEEAPSEKDREAAQRKAEKDAEKEAKRQEKEAEKEAKKQEKEAEKEAKKQEKEEKKRAKTAALIARVEADAVRQAKEEIKKESGEDYDPDESAPAKKESPKKAGFSEKPASAKKSSAEKSGQKKDDAVAKGADSAAKDSEGDNFSRTEKHLRKQYRLHKDLLLRSNRVVPGFVIAKGETVIRTYHCLDSAKGEGTICLTNKRLLLNADERAELDINRISGIKFSKYTKINFMKLVFALIFFLPGILLFLLPFLVKSGMQSSFIVELAAKWKTFYTVLFLFLGVAFIGGSLPFILTMVHKTFYFYVYATDGVPFFECKNRSFAKREQGGMTFKCLISNAGSDSEKAARELGALIIEAKEGRYNFS